MTLTEDDEFSRRFPAERWARVRITLADGRTLASEPARARGNPENPLDGRRAAPTSIRATPQPVLGTARAARIEQAVRAPRDRRAGAAGVARRPPGADHMSHDLPDHAHYVIIGAGIHGLSTAMHLALRLKARGKTVGAERHADRGARQDRHRRGRLGHRLRRRPQQLLPAGDARADGAFACRSGSATPRPTATTRSATCRSAPR